ncbi:MAG: IgGFc-binding protein, partial [Myxococcales bacterium]|nr:IgGFc-binding protein [Polyangiaceae bacterium]MDW8252019.1 IgGFc-binding protein [Myxococcales bacterium]
MTVLRMILAATLAALPLTFLACGGTGSAGTDQSNNGNNGDGGSSSGGGGGGDGPTTCGTCLGKNYVPCNEDGTLAPQVVCPLACVPGRGCLECSPGQPSCHGNEIRTCPESGVTAEGPLVKTCDVGAGEVCVDGACKSGCDLADGLPSNVGCEFWAVDLDQVDAPSVMPGFTGNDPASAPWGIVVSNAGQTVANVTVEINEAPFGQPPSPKALGQVTVPPGTLKTIMLPTRELDCGVKPNDMASPGTCISSNAFRVVSSAPVVVYQFNVFENAFSNDASLLLPTNALGKYYRVLGWGAGHPIEINFPGLPKIISRSFVTVVGAKPDTKVTIKPTTRTHANTTSNPPIPTIQPGETVEFTIGPFDVINLESDNFTPQEGGQTKNLADFTGTLVISDKPVAVFSGAELTGAPGHVEIPKPPNWEGEDSCCLDHLEEQMFPLESIGKKYVVTRSPVRSKGGGYVEPDVLRFVGAAEPATVKTNLPPPFDSFTIQPGEIKDTWTQGHLIVDATAPVL